MKSKILALVLGAVTSVSAVAMPTFSLNTYAGWDGTFQIKLTGFEAFTAGLTVGSKNFGTLKVTSILDGGGSHTLWTDGQNGAELSAVFNGITVAAIQGPLGFGGGYEVASNGGAGSVFLNPFGSLLAAGGFQQGLGGYAAAGGGCAIAGLCYNGISNVVGGGGFFDLNWVSGVLDPLAFTVYGTFTALTTPQSGVGNGYASVVPLSGLYASNFDTNGYSFLDGHTADLKIDNQFCTPGVTGCASLTDAGGAVTSGGWALQINDPIRGNFIPEPGSLALAGLGLLGVAAIRRRRNA